MNVSSKITTAEMREAFRLNLNGALVWRLARGNLRILAYIIVFIVLVVTSLADGHHVDLQKLALLTGLLVLLVGLLIFSVDRTIARAAKAINKAENTFTIDGQGMTVEAPNGVRTAIPWSAIKGWREGQKVFTLGDAKTFRTISRNALGEAQCGELKSLLLAHVR
jgi:hypothetical protein